MIRAHERGDVLTLDVGGPATMTESPAVSDLITDRVGNGIRAVRIDLRDCAMMDSTFSGTLLAMKRQLDKIGGSLTLVSPSEHVLELLGEMGCEDFYDVETADRIDGDWIVVAPVAVRMEKLQRSILEAHDELAQLPGPAGTVFRTVVDELRRTPVPSAKPPTMH